MAIKFLHGFGIQAGQAVIIGSYAGVVEIRLDTEVTFICPDLVGNTVVFNAK